MAVWLGQQVRLDPNQGLLNCGEIFYFNSMTFCKSCDLWNWSLAANIDGHVIRPLIMQYGENEDLDTFTSDCFWFIPIICSPLEYCVWISVLYCNNYCNNHQADPLLSCIWYMLCREGWGGWENHKAISCRCLQYEPIFETTQVKVHCRRKVGSICIAGQWL